MNIIPSIVSSNISLPLSLLIVASLIAFLVYQKKRKAFLEGIPFVSFWAFRKNPTVLAGLISKAAVAGGAKFVAVDTPLRTMVLATHPDSAKAVLKNNEQIIKQPALSSIFTSLIEGSLIFVNKDEWKHQRTVMAPAFHFDYLAEIFPLFIQKTEEVIGLFPKGEVFDAKNWMNHFTVDVLGLAAFGIDFKALQHGEADDYYSSYQTITAYVRTTLRNIIPPNIREMLPLPSVRAARTAREKLFTMTQEVIDQRRTTSKDNNAKQPYLLDMMLDAHPSLSDKKLQTNVFLFFLAGHETTSAALSWALCMLAEHQDIQTRVREEVDRVLNGKHPAPEVLKDMVYLDMFIKEVLRYGSPIAFIGSRFCEEEVEIEGYTLPKNTTTGLAIHAIHHNPEFWPNPEIFNPDRFHPSVASKQHPFAFLPFSLGKRVCIGNTFSLMEQKVFISMLLQSYSVAPPAKREAFALDPASVAYTPKNVNIILTKRANQSA